MTDGLVYQESVLLDDHWKKVLYQKHNKLSYIYVIEKEKIKGKIKN